MAAFEVFILVCVVRFLRHKLIKAIKFRLSFKYITTAELQQFHQIRFFEYFEISEEVKVTIFEKIWKLRNLKNLKNKYLSS